MKKFCLMVLATALFALPALAKDKKDPVLNTDKVYVMYLKSCPMCQKAMEYIDKNYLTYPNVVRADLDTEEGKVLLSLCRQKFEVKNVIVPMVCGGDEYFMGWSQNAEKKFDEMVKK